jgi:hypothetical protein
MMSAETAREATRQIVEKNNAEVNERLSQVIESAVMQGSMKASFFPRNNAERDVAIVILESMGYCATLTRARDQRDRDTIHIGWEV